MYRTDTLLHNRSDLLACPDCDLLMHKRRPVAGQKIQCPRCGCVLERYKKNTVSRSLALALAGIFLYFPAILAPLMTFEKLGLDQSGNVIETIIRFYEKEYFFVAMIIFFSAILFPLVKLSLLATVAGFLQTGRNHPHLGKLFRIYYHLDQWAMVEVYLLGIMVTIVKMYHSTEILYNAGFFCFIGLAVLTIASSVTVNREQFWSDIDNKGVPDLPASAGEEQREPPALGITTAAQNNLLLCRECNKLLPYDENYPSVKHLCPRCGAAVSVRKPASISRTWALVLTAALFFIPANFLPIMRVEFLGIPSHSTILDGISLFFQQGSYGIAIIILTASILIPVFKILGLIIVLCTAQLKRSLFLRQKAFMFRCIEFVGKWSMLDIFVIALLGVFVNFGFLTSVETAPAATYFSIVVVTTMIAAMTFDPRIMWDITATTDPHHSPTQ